MPRAFTEREHAEKKLAFLKAYAQVGIVLPACRAAGISRSTYDTWRYEDPDFVDALEIALDEAIDIAELELRNRAISGIEEPVLFKGEPVWQRDPCTGDLLLDDDFNPIPFTINRRSDRLLEIYLKAKKTEYRDKGALEVTGKDGESLATNFQVTYVLPDGKTEDDYKTIEHSEPERLENHSTMDTEQAQTVPTGGLYDEDD